MDNRKTSADFYPGGKTAISAGGGITSGEGGMYDGSHQVPITSIEGLPERFTDNDLKSKINSICKIIRTGSMMLMAIMAFPVWSAGGITVHGARKDQIFNDDFVVTNVTEDASVLTTNEVCAIVTNTVPGGVGFGDNWRITSGAWDGFSLQSVQWVEEPRALYGGFWRVRVVDGSGFSVGDELTADPPTAWRLLPFGGMVVERDREAVNALGLAMAKDLEGIVASVSNTVVEIVTNEIMVGWTEWVVRQTSEYDGVVCSGVYATDGPSPDEPVHWMIDCKEWSELHGLQEQKYHVPGTGAETNLTFTSGLMATRRRVTQNALGLAMAKDTVSAKAVTNIARDVSNSFWDEKNSVLWRLDFRDGEPMFVPVTNENVKATGGVM